MQIIKDLLVSRTSEKALGGVAITYLWFAILMSLVCWAALSINEHGMGMSHEIPSPEEVRKTLFNIWVPLPFIIVLGAWLDHYLSKQEKN